MPIKTVIIEDEENCVYLLEQLIKEYAPECHICGTASHVENAVRLIEDIRPEVVFIDIRMADGTGFDVLGKLSSHAFELIFVTAFDSYALDAIRHSAIDYLLKPIGIPEFETSMDRLRKRLSEKVQHNALERLLKQLTQQSQPDQNIAIPTTSGYDFICLKDVLWCKSDGTYTTFHMADKSRVLSSRNIGVFEDVLIRNNFFRIHHSIIINMRWVRQYVRGKGGFVVLSDGMKLQVSQRRKAEFMEKLSL